MSHHVFTGSFAALQARWLDDIVRLQHGSPLRPVPVLIGSNLLASYLKVRIAEQGRAAANLRFYTFLDLARRLAQSAVKDARPRLPGLGGATILDDLLAGAVPKVFAAVRSFPGFRENLLDTFRDLRDAGISESDFEREVRTVQQRSPDRAEHLKGLAQLYRKFRARTGQYTDVDDDFRDAAANAAHAGEILGSTRLFVYGVYDVTGQQQDLLSALKESLELSYYIPFTDADASGFAEPFVSLCARELRVAAEPLRLPPRQDSLSLLPDRSPDVELADDGSFALVSAPGESRVAVEIVREVLRAVRDGVAAGFYDIAVLLRHPREQAPLLAEAFRLRGVAHFRQGGSPFEERPLCRAVLAIAELSADAFARAGVLRAMELVAAALPAHEAREWSVQQWRVLTNDARFLAGVESWNSGTESLVVQCLQDLAAAQEAPGEGDETVRRVHSVPTARYRLAGAQSLRSAWLAVRDASDAWPAALTWSEWAQLLEVRLQPLLGAADDWNVFSNVLDGISALDALSNGRENARVARARFVSCLRESLRDRTLPQGRFLRNGVNLLPIGMARGLRFPVVIVPGLEEGSFPARPRQDPLLLDAERKAIGGLYTRLPLKARRVEEDKLLFDMAVRSAERRLVLLTSRLDESTDRERIPSEFFLRVAETARSSPVTLRDLQEGKIPAFRSVSLENPAPRPGQVPTDPGEVRLRLLTADEHEARHVIQALARMEPDLLGRSLAFDRARWARELTPFDGRISDSELARYVAFRAGPAAGQVSPTRMEEYARCPYLFFLKRIIGLQEWEEPEAAEAMDPLKRGSAVHSMLERFVRDYGGARLATEPRETLQRVLAGVARQELEAARPPGIPDLLWELECEGVQELLRNWLDFERNRTGAGMEPCAVEHVFGTFPDEEVRPAVRIEAGRHVFEFRGRIDRVDVSPDGRRARVIDYKTGSLPKTMEKPSRPAIMAGEKIQIAVYRAAVLASGCWPSLGEIEGEYLHLQPQNKAIVPCAYDDGRLQQGMERLGQILEVVGDGLCRGVFFARTAGTVYKDNCKFCGYKIICGKDVARRDELKSGDPEVARFRRACAADIEAEEP